VTKELSAYHKLHSSVLELSKHSPVISTFKAALSGLGMVAMKEGTLIPASRLFNTNENPRSKKGEGRNPADLPLVLSSGRL
jgi:hypothetical protein